MSKTTLYILAAILVIIIIAVGAYLFLYGGLGGNQRVNISDATSVQFDADVTTAGTTATYKFSAKNFQSSDLKLRVDVEGGQQDYSYIITGHQAYANENGTWQNRTNTFNEVWSVWYPIFEGHTDSLVHWEGTGDWTYTAGAESNRLYDIKINPNLDDSLFNPT